MSDHNDIQKLLDIQEIMALKGKYCRCVDTKDWAGYGALLTEDYFFDSEGVINQGRENVVAHVSNSMQGTVSFHRVCNPEIVVTGDTATGVWSMTDYVIFDKPGMKFKLRGYGWYHENYARTPAGWRLTRCVLKRQRVDLDGDIAPALRKHMEALPGYHFEN